MGAEVRQTANWKQIRQLDRSPTMIKTMHLALSWLSLLSGHQDKLSSKRRCLRPDDVHENGTTAATTSLVSNRQIIATAVLSRHP
jgi:hypothetical protein